ncbi:hypothetical protein DEV91_110141 [Phyllobacterium brassicacearum]|nr:hypothetical protein DEV91_110141 [Phyllobacterium brassicacearum]
MRAEIWVFTSVIFSTAITAWLCLFQVNDNEPATRHYKSTWMTTEFRN